MGRPRKTETRQSVTIRLAPELLTSIDAAAEQRACNRTTLIERILAASEDIGGTKPAIVEQPTPPIAKATVITELKAKLHTERADCTHTWKKLSYGNFCSKCGARQKR